MRKPRKPTQAEAELYRSVRSAARWLASNTSRNLSTARGRQKINSALDVVHYASESLLRMRKLSDGGGPHPIGFDVGGELLDVNTEWDDTPDHGLEEEHEHDPGEPATAKRRR